MLITIDGVTAEGVLVVPQKDVSKMIIVAQGDLDLFTFQTCHREEIAEDAGNVVERRGLFRRKIVKKREIELEYRPNFIEKSGGCPVYVGGFEQEKGRHSWGIVDFETSDSTLPADVFCNGEGKKSKGVAICQSRVGLIQAIKFSSPVKVKHTPACDIGVSEGTYFEFPIVKGQCVYAFYNPDKKIHRLTTIGYEQIPIRK